jgi:hypothetical protein
MKCGTADPDCAALHPGYKLRRLVGIVGGAGLIDYHAQTSESAVDAGGNEAPMLHGFLRTLVKVAVASLIVGTILGHFGITTEQVIKQFGLSQDRIMELARQGVTWALPNLLLGSLVIVPVWFLVYLFRPPGRSSD